jgi:hypothetical protein
MLQSNNPLSRICQVRVFALYTEPSVKGCKGQNRFALYTKIAAPSGDLDRSVKGVKGYSVSIAYAREAAFAVSRYRGKCRFALYTLYTRRKTRRRLAIICVKGGNRLPFTPLYTDRAAKIAAKTGWFA